MSEMYAKILNVASNQQMSNGSEVQKKSRFENGKWNVQRNGDKTDSQQLGYE